jgi:hypothetical protein
MLSFCACVRLHSFLLTRPPQPLPQTPGTPAVFFFDPAAAAFAWCSPETGGSLAAGSLPPSARLAVADVRELKSETMPGGEADACFCLKGRDGTVVALETKSRCAASNPHVSHLTEGPSVAAG